MYHTLGENVKAKERTSRMGKSVAESSICNDISLEGRRNESVTVYFSANKWVAIHTNSKLLLFGVRFLVIEFDT